MIEVRMDRVLGGWSVMLFVAVLAVCLHNLIFPQNWFAQGVVEHIRLALIVWVAPVTIAFSIVNFYETVDLWLGWEQFEAAFERLIRFLGGLATITIVLVALSYL